MADAFYPEEYIKEENRKILLSIGRLSPQKGFDFAIDAARILKDEGLKFIWFIIGQGELKEKLQEQIKQKHLEDCFVLLGVRENPYPYIKNADLVIQPSRYEGKSVVLDETKILAKPLIVTNYPTVHDQIMDGKEGVIVDIAAEAISNGIMELLNNEILYESIKNYMTNNEYGNVSEMVAYYKLFDS